ncbi:MAG: prolyl oligopeptidase family serine peptidase [Verrucomicrobiae bacterium]|nr:prolyl oligopeptidase family serine peptidase [Verrucomicrobiae bacterium]
MSLVLLLALVASLVFPQPSRAAEPSAVLDLWPGGRMPGEPARVDGPEGDLSKPDDKRIAGKPIVRLGNVSTPQIHLYLPPREKANGAAVAICPGGGFSLLAWDLEGIEVAEWLNQLGIAAAVVKYRVPTREEGGEGAAAPGDPEVTAPKKAIGPLMDTQRAISHLRAHAADWQIDPNRVGVMGFSAGGETAALAAVSLGKRAYASIDATDEASCAADFALLIYPGGLANPDDGSLKPFYQVSEATPPMFFVHAADDRVTPLASSALFQALELAGVPAELHIFATGGHGYGLRPTESPITHWPNRAEKWLREMKLLGGAETSGADRTGDPADHLPPWIRRLTWIGERPDWRHDGRRVLFVSKVYGDAYEYEMATGRIHSLSDHFPHHGFTRALYLANGDVLLVGPSETFDRTDKADRKRARHDIGRMYLLQRPFDHPPVDLGVEVDEGPAISRTRMNIAWTHGEQAEISTAEIAYRNGKPELANIRKVLDLSAFPAGTRMIETQNFIPPADRAITLSAYQLGGTKNTDTFTFNLETGELVNRSNSPDFYDEPEGIFPDGRHTLVEHADSKTSAWPLVDLYKLSLDGSGTLERLTRFAEFPGYKASQGVVSDDGRQMIFQIGKSGDEAGQGYGFFLYDFEKAEAMGTSSNVPR